MSATFELVATISIVTSYTQRHFMRVWTCSCFECQFAIVCFACAYFVRLLRPRQDRYCIRALRVDSPRNSLTSLFKRSLASSWRGTTIAATKTQILRVYMNAKCVHNFRLPNMHLDITLVVYTYLRFEHKSFSKMFDVCIGLYACRQFCGCGWIVGGKHLDVIKMFRRQTKVKPTKSGAFVLSISIVVVCEVGRVLQTFNRGKSFLLNFWMTCDCYQVVDVRRLNIIWITYTRPHTTSQGFIFLDTILLNLI